MKAPEQTLARRTPRLAIPRTKVRVLSHLATASTPSPPATTRVLIAPERLKPRATISTPEVLRTGPGFAANTLIEGLAPLKRVAISNTEIGPAASSSWKPGNTRMPIMIEAVSENEGNMAFQTRAHNGRMGGESGG